MLTMTSFLSGFMINLLQAVIFFFFLKGGNWNPSDSSQG